MKVYILEAPHTTLAVATDLDRARRWRDEIREHEDAPRVTIYEMVANDPPEVCAERRAPQGEGGDGE